MRSHRDGLGPTHEEVVASYLEDLDELLAEVHLLRKVATEARAMLAGGEDGPAERCPDCGCGGYGYLRDALAALEARTA